MGLIDNLNSVARNIVAIEKNSRAVNTQLINQAKYTNHFSSYESYLLAVKKIDWVYSCVSLLAYTLAKRQPLVYKTGTDELVEKHPFIDLFNKPNSSQTNFELREEMFGHLILTGNAYTELAGQNSKFQPEYLYNLRPSYVKVVPGIEDFVAGYVFVNNDGGVPFLNTEMLHHKLANPSDPFYGLGVIEACERTFSSEIERQLTELAWFTNRIQPSGILSVPEFTEDEQFNAFVTAWKSQHGGSGNRFNTAILEGDVKYQQLQANFDASGYAQLSKDGRDRILAAFGVPKQKLGITDTADYKTEQMDQYFYEETCTPYWEREVQTWNEWLKTVGWDDITLVADVPRVDNKTLKTELAVKALSTYSMTTNEIRAMMELPPLADGENILMPLNLAPTPVVVDEKSYWSEEYKALVDKLEAYSGSKSDLPMLLDKNIEDEVRVVYELGLKRQYSVKQILEGFEKENYPGIKGIKKKNLMRQRFNA